jgi:hypothetical protein
MQDAFYAIGKIETTKKTFYFGEDGQEYASISARDR